MSENALILNSSYEPLVVVSSQRALLLILTGKAEYVEEDSENSWHSPSVSFAVPVVVRLIRYVKLPMRNHIGLTRRALMARDNNKCVYCGGTEELTIDHVTPKSRGGLHTWENTVIADKKCNAKKKDKTLEELGWTLSKPPRAPTGITWRIIGYRTPDPRWLPWLNQ